MKFQTRTLGDICDAAGGFIRTGPFGSQLHESDYVEQGIPVIMPKNIVEGKVSTEDIAYINETNAQRLSAHRLNPGDIVYGRRGDIGRRAIITRREAGWLCGTGCLRISQVNTILEPSFLYYFLGQREIVTWIANHAIGATLPNLNTGILRKVPIVYPPLPIQHTIASILSAYDDLIENNTRRIAILEETAQMLYQEWFVKFRFPGYEQVKMVESELGMIPEEWEVVRFIDIADILSGGTPKTTVAEYWNGDIPFYTPRDAPDTFFTIATEKTITISGLDSCNSRLYPKDTVFITARGTVGKVALNAIDMAMNQSCYALRGRDSISQLFIFMHILNCIRHLKQSANGAVFDTIVVDTFKQLRVFKPSHSLINSFTRAVSPTFDQIQNLIQKNTLLRHTRDLLLPKLISGEIDVSSWVHGDAEEAALALAGSVASTAYPEYERPKIRVTETGPVAKIEKEGMAWESLWE